MLKLIIHPLVLALTVINAASAAFVPDFKIKRDDITVLMAVDAELSDGLTRISHSGHGKFQVSGCSRADQSATWKVSLAEAAGHEVYVLVKRADSQPLSFQLTTGDHSVRGRLPANGLSWQRVPLDGLLDLPAGASTLSLRIAAADGKDRFNAEIHAVELVRPEVRKSLEELAVDHSRGRGPLSRATGRLVVR